MLHILIGQGKIILDGQSMPYAPVSRFNVSRETSHGFVIGEETIFLSIQSSPIYNKETGELDIQYREDKNE